MMQLTDGRALSVLKDPFSVPCVTGIELHWHKFVGRVHIWSTVRFENGHTKGEQKFEAASMPELMAKTEAFLKTLPR